ncbi:MAG: S8 family serine peptidase [Bacteroidota bacterium]
MRKHLLFVFICVSSVSFAQKKKPDNWQTLNPSTEKVYGVGSEEAYKLLKDKKPKTVVVAVIDSGIDPNHEDLKDAIWTNTAEIPDNEIDDDHNGYIDDVHGWSFLGGKNGDIDHEATELARIYQRQSKKFDKLDTTKLSLNDATEFVEYKKIRTAYNKEQQLAEQELMSVAMISTYLDNVKKENNGKLDKVGLNKYTPISPTEKRMKKGLKLAFAFGIKAEELEGQVKEAKDQLENEVKNNRMNADSIRTYIVGDDLNNVNERYYGNNHIQGPDAMHGTHVSGIIAAIRTNSIGIKGIADNVKIMIIRAVPSGDERDKDIANSIRYAVDNGAKIINMSFGKYCSPDKKAVDEAVKYAESKDVLIVHAAGNESKDNNKELSFPNRHLQNGEIASNWLSVGANASERGKTMIGSFSNYGSNEVDLFAPGVDIYSTIPDNKYASESGTSMAAPCAAGAAAIIREYFPELKSNEVRDILMKSVVTCNQRVKVPGVKRGKKKIKELCISGGFINANNAVKELLGLNKAK